ncbi:MAG: phosphoribosylformylglycinamidine synthase subunit PurL [Deltaproteobacteria bacterium]|jgi:phosphoribosylformylglycinamidine synthase|nr:phosphoribosylformylglycinamidine synthase subunit PurL [Deltaproteobacteria bacterium]
MNGNDKTKDNKTDETVWTEHGLSEDEHGRILRLMGREPNYLELAIFGVMWSEHCCYKSSKLQLKKFPTDGPQVLQGPGENAGVVDLGDGWGVAFKMESHNHPSAIEPFQGAATGVGGIIRDIFAMGARPVASLDSLRFGEITNPRVKALLNGVVAGIGGYGNCMGIPTVAGETHFHPAYLGNPLVNAMSVGLLRTDRIFRGRADGPGNVVMLVGARTGRDGIKGASFASEELSDQDPDKRHTVQVGDPFMEKLLLEATLEILDQDLVVGLQDLGAAGLTSSGCEMAGRAGSGLYMDLDLVPLREQGLADWEMMLSESQERMLLIVEPAKVEAVRKVFDKWDLLSTAVGEVTGDGCFTLRRGERVLATIPAAYLTDKAPVYSREYREPEYRGRLKGADLSPVRDHADFGGLLERLLASPNLSSRHWVYEQYDSSVGLNTVIGPSGDGALLRVPGTRKGIALSCDCNSRYAYLDPYLGGAIAVAESALNVAVTGARPLGLTNCLNFGNPENPEIFWQFVKATDGLADAARALDTPVTGGNVSFYNEYDGRAIHPAPVVGMLGLLDDLDCRMTFHFKSPGDLVVLIGRSLEELGATEAHYLLTGRDEGPVPALDLAVAARLNAFLARAASLKLLASAHDVADGGLAVALAEASFPLELGLDLAWKGEISPAAALFGESQSRVVASVTPEGFTAAAELLSSFNLPYTVLGRTAKDGFLKIRYNSTEISAPVPALKAVWRGALEQEAEI